MLTVKKLFLYFAYPLSAIVFVASFVFSLIRIKNNRKAKKTSESEQKKSDNNQNGKESDLQ